MFVMTGNNTAIVNIDRIIKIAVQEKEDAWLVIAICDGDDRPVIMGRYATKDDAADALAGLHKDLGSPLPCAIMPSTGSKPYAAINRYHGAKQKGHGGS